MPAERLSMRKIKEVLRLKFELGLGNRQIARSCSINHNTVNDYVRRATAAGLNRWPLPADLDDAAMEARLFPPRPTLAAVRPAPDWPAIHDELRCNKHVTLQLLWQEHKLSSPDGYSYSRFCELYQQWLARLDLVLRQEHRAGEKLFVDYAGATVPIIDSETGEVQDAAIFVAVLGASNYTYAEATWNQGLLSWIGSHIRALEFFQGCPALVVPDNLKNAVTRPCRYEPDLNPGGASWHPGVGHERLELHLYGGSAHGPLGEGGRRQPQYRHSRFGSSQCPQHGSR